MDGPPQVEIDWRASLARGIGFKPPGSGSRCYLVLTGNHFGWCWSNMPLPFDSSFSRSYYAIPVSAIRRVEVFCPALCFHKVLRIYWTIGSVETSIFEVGVPLLHNW